MQCGDCKTENPDGSRFCVECAAPLAKLCPNCSQSNIPRAKFCSNCGAALTAPATAPRSVRQPEPDQGERRHLTVLFCDLVDSTAISAALDPEQWHEIAADYQRSTAAAVTAVGGHVAKFLGDGLVVYFGYPEAQEDAAERALRGGLAILETMVAVNERFARDHGIKLQVRVGIHAGSVVIARGGGTDADMFGDAPNIASRVQAAAEPDSVFITAAVHELVAGMFVVEDRGQHRLKGIENPVQLFRATSTGLARARARNFAPRESIPFVGRDDELQFLLGRWKRVCRGEGQLVLLIGEPGIGKSRLVHEFLAAINRDPHLRAECGGAPFLANTPFQAVIELLHQGLGWRGDESGEERMRVLESALDRSGVKLAEAVPLIGELLGLEIPAKYPPLIFSPEQRRKRLLAALAAWVFGATRNVPVLVVVEDLHWVDPSTMELIQKLVEQLATAPVMLLCTARPEFQAPWPMRSHRAQITLNRLTTAETRELVEGVMARAGLSADVMDAVVQRTDGVPLFAEELTRLMLETSGRSGAHDIPATLLDSLGARLDRLGRAKEVAQLSAVLGRQFSYELLRAVSPLSEDELQASLAKLADAELVYAQGVPPDATYQFKHALIQDAAYGALLKSKRRDLHGRIAQIMIDRFPALAEAQPQVLADHWFEAGESEKAFASWTKAAEQAAARQALGEAAENYRRALAALATIPETPGRDARELEILTPLAKSLMGTRGFEAAAGQANARSLELAKKNGRLTELGDALCRTFILEFLAGKYRDGAHLAQQVADVERQLSNDSTRGNRHWSGLLIAIIRGDLRAVEEHLSSLEALWKGIGPWPFERPSGLALAAVGAWLRGDRRLSRDRARRAADTSSENLFARIFIEHVEMLTYCLAMDSVRVDLAAKRIAATLETFTLPLYAGYGQSALGWVAVRDGQATEGIAQIRAGLARVAEEGLRFFVPVLITLLADAHRIAGTLDEAAEAMENAFTANPDEHVIHPFMLCVRGTIHSDAGRRDAAESDFREAILLSETMGAASFGLRAATALAAILRDKGELASARAVLAAAVDRMPPEADDPDITGAQALLTRLA